MTADSRHFCGSWAASCIFILQPRQYAWCWRADYTSNQRRHTLSRSAGHWWDVAQMNNLTLNQAKSIAIVFADHRQKLQVNKPASTIARHCLRLIHKDVTMLNSMSIVQRVQNVAIACVYCRYRRCTLCDCDHKAWRIQHRRWSTDHFLLVGCSIYAASAWYSFCTAAEKNYWGSNRSLQHSLHCWQSLITDVAQWVVVVVVVVVERTD